jgi:hypothetical protein
MTTFRDDFSSSTARIFIRRRVYLDAFKKNAAERFRFIIKAIVVAATTLSQSNYEANRLLKKRYSHFRIQPAYGLYRIFITSIHALQ